MARFGSQVSVPPFVLRGQAAESRPSTRGYQEPPERPDTSAVYARRRVVSSSRTGDDHASIVREHGLRVLNTPSDIIASADSPILHLHVIVLFRVLFSNSFSRNGTFYGTLHDYRHRYASSHIIMVSLSSLYIPLVLAHHPHARLTLICRIFHSSIHSSSFIHCLPHIACSV